jgi:hypothetical protein
VSGLAGRDGQEPLADLPLAPCGHTFQVGRDSLRAALDATVLSRTGRAVGVDDQGRVVGITTYERLRAAIQTAEEASTDPGQPVFREGRAAVPEAQLPEAQPAGEGARRS